MQYMVNNNLATQLNDGRYYIKQESDDSTQSGLIYDPTRKALYNTFLGDVTSEWDIIKRKHVYLLHTDRVFLAFATEFTGYRIIR
jgi:hypothetical protein